MSTSIFSEFTDQQIYPVNLVKKGYNYYLTLLTEKATGMYLYRNLPDSLPADQIELRLILNGYCVIFTDKKTGEIVTCNGGLSGIDKYYLPTDFVYAQPALGSGNLKVWKNCVIIYNNSIDKYARVGLSEIIMRTARLLADIDASINIITINNRATKLNVAANKSVAKTVDNAMQAIADGTVYTINTNSLLDMYKTLDWNSTTKQQQLQELLDAKEQILTGFLSEIGVKNMKEKKERLITDEVTADQQVLTINVDDMLSSRQSGVEALNKMFNLHAAVYRNPSYDISSYESEVNKNVDQ